MLARNAQWLKENDLWLIEEEALSPDEPSDVMRTLPEVRPSADPDRDDEELGLRAILERPRALSRAWSHSVHASGHRPVAKAVRRNARRLRAA